MKKNKSLNLQITLPPKPGEMIVYSFAGTGPIVDHDPVLNLNPPSFDISPEKIVVLWEDIKYASYFVLYENGNEVKRLNFEKLIHGFVNLTNIRKADVATIKIFETMKGYLN